MTKRNNNLSKIRQTGLACRQAGMVELVILALGVVAVLVAGYFLIKTFKKAEIRSTEINRQIDQLAKDTSTTQTTQSAITSDLQSQVDTISVDNIDTSFGDIDRSLNKL